MHVNLILVDSLSKSGISNFNTWFQTGFCPLCIGFFDVTFTASISIIILGSYFDKNSPFSLKIIPLIILSSNFIIYLDYDLSKTEEYRLIYFKLFCSSYEFINMLPRFLEL